MNNDISLDIVSEILQGVTVVESDFGILYFKHLSQHEQRALIAKSTVFEAEAKSKGLPTKEEALEELFAQEMWSKEEEALIQNYQQEVELLKESASSEILPSKKEIHP